jgi:hypothetical protein
MVGSGAGVTVTAIVVVPVPQLWQSTPAAYSVAVLLVVTVGAIKLNVQVLVVLGEE